MRKEIFVLGPVRTAIGTFGGSFRNTRPIELASQVIGESLHRSKVDPETVGHVVMGHVCNTEPKDMYLSRAAAVYGGLPESTPAFNLNRLCGSGLSAIIAGAQMINEDQTDVAIAGGAEVMSRVPHWLPTQRFGQKMGNAELVDAMLGALSDPFDEAHMGVTAERVAARYHISREAQDALAAQSHQRAASAIEQGFFTDQILPIEVRAGRKSLIFDTDEHVKPDTTSESLASLRPVFQKDGTVTAGNASGINDAACVMTLASAQAVKAQNLAPMARLVDYAFVALDPKVMGLGPVPATERLLKQTGLSIDYIDVWEVNEAFAAQALGVCHGLDIDPAIVNPNGSGISLGHPIGATGAIVATKAIYELHRTQKRYAIATLCIGGGQGVAALFERA